MDAPRKSAHMPAGLISLNEASSRLEQKHISGRMFAELLLTGQPLLFGLYPGSVLHKRIDFSRVISFKAEHENVVVTDNIKWTDIRLNWIELCAAFKTRGRSVAWSWFSDITPEVLARARQPMRRHLGDLGPGARPTPIVPATPPPERRASWEWFVDTKRTGLSPSAGKMPPGKRGPKSNKRMDTADTMRQHLTEGKLTETSLKAMPEKELADRYGVSRDTARKARHDVLSQLL
jgi:hypothetical protein